MTAPDRNPIAVSCRGLVKQLGSGSIRTRVLHGIDLDVFPGEMTFLLGPSGCGKTTLISTIAGLLVADEGKVELFGTNLAELGRRSLVHFRGAGVGVVFQQLNLFPALTATENVAVPLLVQGRAGASAKALAQAMLREVGLETHLTKYPSQLSIGERQRVAIARALIHEPRLIICDEPTSALDGASGQRVMELLRKVARDPGRAVLVVTHDARIVPFADRIAHMSDGRITRIDVRTEREAA
ncbi:ABC transporter related protein precursor [Bosea sp. LC85]|uniref:ABC transporter ATP-binding protein n=1 Tax=Bosea sp. LC85 TaxID=1502851 RepID=UPI0004E3CD39|nr:ABC transporter ATP-binding protein [Bosea sp. LC85]KFC72754.1 ABC transporter related protein precursor [Bosea sp. LC85]